jgi:hypothetical protein
LPIILDACFTQFFGALFKSSEILIVIVSFMDIKYMINYVEKYLNV